LERDGIGNCEWFFEDVTFMYFIIFNDVVSSSGYIFEWQDELMKQP
jgi:hypothetical protein